MVAKKLGWIKKAIGDVGKKLFFRQTDKINMFLMIAIVQSVIEEYRIIHEGNLSRALETLAQGAGTGASEIVADLIEKPVMAGMGMKFLLSKHLPDVALQIEWTLWSLAGKNAEKIFGKPMFIPAENSTEGVPEVVIPIKQCVMCAAKTDIKPEDLGNHDYFHVITELAEAAIQHIQDYVENRYRVLCRETKCFLRGDDQGELTVFFYPKDKTR